ncbi:MAG: SMC-Scp complex subunit ScpB [Candidatus Pacebacteria bacterium]|nr:SMC-Scp complex subunit ScpB [Candidatus Paceibacterota bacterium]
MSNSVSRNIEAILFHKAESVKVKELSKILEVSKEEVQEALDHLEKTLEGRGVKLLKNDNAVMLGTTPETAVIIEKIIKQELDKELGKAGLEALSIVLYRGPISRGEIDYIRGVNSSHILRSMVMRGLVQRTRCQEKKAFVYSPTFELLSYLGVSCVEELPEYEAVQRELQTLTAENEQEKESELEQEINNE